MHDGDASAGAQASAPDAGVGPAPGAAPMLELEHVSCRFAHETVVRDVSLRLAVGELGCLLGPSGCGKTTLLRAIAGFHPLSAGAVRVRGSAVADARTQVAPERRGIGFVFQDLALFPHLTVARNVAFGLAGLAAARRSERIGEVLSMLHLEAFAQRYPHELSGGQQQRVALARALARRPDLLLLDEPFSSLDAHLRASLREELRGLLKRLGLTAVLVTHDQDEAFAFADRVGVMHAGRLEQWASSFEVYHRPLTPFVARFVGEGRLLSGTVDEDGAIVTGLGHLRGVLPPGTRAGERVRVLVRPDDLLPAPETGLEAEVRSAAFRGAETLYTLRLADGSEVCALFPSHRRHAPGERIHVRTDLAHLVVFPADDAETVPTQ